VTEKLSIGDLFKYYPVTFHDGEFGTFESITVPVEVAEAVGVQLPEKHGAFVQLFAKHFHAA